MFAVVNAAGEVFYGTGTQPAFFKTRESAEVIASYFTEVGTYGPLMVSPAEEES